MLPCIGSTARLFRLAPWITERPVIRGIRILAEDCSLQSRGRAAIPPSIRIILSTRYPLQLPGALLVDARQRPGCGGIRSFTGLAELVMASRVT